MSMMDDLNDLNDPPHDFHAAGSLSEEIAPKRKVQRIRRNPGCGLSSRRGSGMTRQPPPDCSTNRDANGSFPRFSARRAAWNRKLSPSCSHRIAEGIFEVRSPPRILRISCPEGAERLVNNLATSASKRFTTPYPVHFQQPPDPSIV
jgi:hypothetical protein